MLISVDEKAVSWFKNEFEIYKPLHIRMYPQYAGFGEQHKGYSLAFSAETPANAGIFQEVDGINFFVEGSDVWFFEEAETYLSVDAVLNELQIKFKETVY